MNIVDVATTQARRAPLPGGPAVRPLLGRDCGCPAAVLHMTLPAGGHLPEHDHGPSHVVLIPLQGRIRLHQAGHDHDLGPGVAAHIDVGERVSLANPGPGPAELVVVATPPDFAEGVAAWPPA